MIPLAYALCAVLGSIALLHAYWAFGGRFAAGVAIPKHGEGRAVFSPGPVACLAVTLGLAGFAWICLVHVYLAESYAIARFTRAILLVMSGIFLLRTLGDFKYVGISRRIRDTDFARYDRLVFTPLCFMLGALVAILAMGVNR